MWLGGTSSSLPPLRKSTGVVLGTFCTDSNEGQCSRHRNEKGPRSGRSVGMSWGMLRNLS